MLASSSSDVFSRRLTLQSSDWNRNLEHGSLCMITIIPESIVVSVDVRVGSAIDQKQYLPGERPTHVHDIQVYCNPDVHVKPRGWTPR